MVMSKYLAEMNVSKKRNPVSGTVNAAMIGLGFGAEFIPMYKAHPNANVTALFEDRDPRPSAVTSANWTCVGICAHESATKGGAIVRLPEFTLP